MYDYCNLYKRKERYLVCDHTGMEPNIQRQIQSLQSILRNEEVQDKEIASVSYKYFYYIIFNTKNRIEFILLNPVLPYSLSLF